MKVDVPAVLIRIARNFSPTMTEDRLYEATRKWWVSNPHRHEPDYAFSVARGVVRAVYRIDRWERSTSDPRRWAFHGSRDEELERRYKGAGVSEHFTQGAQNPITYVNC